MFSEKGIRNNSQSPHSVNSIDFSNFNNLWVQHQKDVNLLAKLPSLTDVRMGRGSSSGGIATTKQSQHNARGSQVKISEHPSIQTANAQEHRESVNVVVDTQKSNEAQSNNEATVRTPEQNASRDKTLLTDRVNTQVLPSYQDANSGSNFQRMASPQNE